MNINSRLKKLEEVIGPLTRRKKAFELMKKCSSRDKSKQMTEEEFEDFLTCVNYTSNGFKHKQNGK